ncbi:hypothetical protein [Paraburkholderia dinghuensis]|uniref:HoxN/HupN/NixA family nickel/cobalt transporter n=1 Tax=Paraburkholderia dinghuensis TaxID=2305225 RepID=UPI0024830186|nr:hypothetical protein [Paraburkholderia dinghuensis]
MAGGYLKPIRKIYYHMTITFVSVVVAVVIGGIEARGLPGDQLKLHGPAWDVIGAPNENFGTLGYFTIAISFLSWLAAVVIHGTRHFDELEINR